VPTADQRPAEAADDAGERRQADAVRVDLASGVVKLRTFQAVVAAVKQVGVFRAVLDEGPRGVHGT
jgi:hypothetical protein